MSSSLSVKKDKRGEGHANVASSNNQIDLILPINLKKQASPPLPQKALESN